MTKTTTLDKFTELEKILNDEILERPDEIRSSLLALLSRRHMFMYGKPGIGKSFLVDRLVARIDGLDENNYFKWLLTKFSVPEELFGGPDFKLMQEQGIYKRITERKLPRASIAFCDEIYKANSAILNSLLTILNERKFENCEDDPTVPLMTMFAASNELPASSELEALADRLHFWHLVQPLNEPSNFVKMLQSELDENPDKMLSLDDIHKAQREVQTVEVPDLIYQVFIDIKNRLRADDIYVTDRRFHQTIDVIKAQAWLNGRTTVEVVDMKPLMHMLWRIPDNIDKVRDIILNLVDPLEQKVVNLRREFEKAIEEWESVLVDSDLEHTHTDATVKMLMKYKEMKAELEQLRDEQKESGRICDPLVDLERRSKVIVTKVYNYLQTPAE